MPGILKLGHALFRLGANAVQGSCRPTLRPALEVDAGVHSDSIDPAGKLGFKSESLQSAEDLTKRLLGGIESVRGIARDPEANAIHAIFVAVVDRPECPLIPLLARSCGLTLFHEVPVGIEVCALTSYQRLVWTGLARDLFRDLFRDLVR